MDNNFEPILVFIELYIYIYWYELIDGYNKLNLYEDYSSISMGIIVATLI